LSVVKLPYPFFSFWRKSLSPLFRGLVFPPFFCALSCRSCTFTIIPTPSPHVLLVLYLFLSFLFPVFSGSYNCRHVDCPVVSQLHRSGRGKRNGVRRGKLGREGRVTKYFEKVKVGLCRYIQKVTVFFCSPPPIPPLFLSIEIFAILFYPIFCYLCCGFYMSLSLLFFFFSYRIVSY